MPIGSAPMAYAIWKQMKHNPKDPAWQARDRFVLSAGHASMLEYALLHLFGYPLGIEDLKAFRQWGSKTPGHPEYGHTVGVEATSGPLGQGIAMAVGMAMAESHLAAIFNREGYPVVDNYTYVLMGDGCMMEGVQAEAAALAGVMQLHKLIVLYDSNRITIEGSTDIALTEDVQKRYEAYGWDVQQVADGEDVAAIEAAIAKAKTTSTPSLIIVHTNIAHGTPKEGKASAHGEPLGAENIAAMREFYHWEAAPFEIPQDVRDHFAAMLPGFEKQEADYNAMFQAYQAAYPELYAQWQAYHSKELPEALLQDDSLFAADKPTATRASSGTVLNKLNQYLPNLFGGSADLAPSNKTSSREKPSTPLGTAQAKHPLWHPGICHGGCLQRHSPLRRLKALLRHLHGVRRLPQACPAPLRPDETAGDLCADPRQHRRWRGRPHPSAHRAPSRPAGHPGHPGFRPADTKETAACYIAALRHGLPAVMALTRQNLPQYAETSRDVERGAYILRDTANGLPDVILMASGSEVQCIMEAADALEKEDISVRVVSVPCMDLFEQQDVEYQESVLPRAVTARVAVEAASSFGWHKYTGLDGKVIAIDHFGASAPAGTLFQEFGINTQAVIDAARSLVK